MDVTLGLPGVARVLPDVTGLDKSFDYAVPLSIGARLQLGDVVRVDLHGRRVRGWVVELDPADADPQRDLLPIVKWSSRGPDRSLIELAGWASIRWAAGRLRPFLVTATPPTNVAADLRDGTTAAIMATPDGSAGGQRPDVIRLGPTVDPLPLVLERVRGRRALVIHPSVGGAMALANRLGRADLRVALWPDQWAAGAGGVDVVVGTRAAAWARLPRLEAVVLLDEHDEALQEERAPTWHARDVVVERARRAGAACTLVSPCPTAAAAAYGPVVAAAPVGDERAAWPVVEVLDRSAEAPWKRSLVTSRLVEELRDVTRRVVCITNTPGRARRLACRSCRSLLRCANCAAAVSQADDGRLVCARCDAVRPPVCQVCGSAALANVRPGVTRLREELEAAASRPVQAVSAASDEPLTADVFVGTEAALHRVGRVDTVAFVDFDAELLAPRYRAEEQTVALLIRAARMVGGRRGPGRILIQTHLGDHEVIRAVQHVDLARFGDQQLERRRVLGLPPFGALAALSGPGHEAFAAVLAERLGVTVAPGADVTMVRAADWMTLGQAIVDTPRPPKSRIRVEVDPPR